MSAQQLETSNDSKQMNALVFETTSSVRIEAIPKPPQQSQLTLGWLLMKAASPTLMQVLVQNIAFSCVIYFISLKNDAELLGSFGLGLTIYNVTFSSFLTALNSGFSTLGAQAYGANNPLLLGLYYKKALVIGFLTVWPAIILFMFSGKLLTLCRFDQSFSYKVQSVLLATLPSALGNSYFDVSKNYLVAQKIFAPQGYIQLVMTLFDITNQYLTIVHFDLGIVGYGIGKFLNETGRAILIHLYIRYSKKCSKSTVPWSADSFRGIIKQWKFQITAGGIVILEILANQLIHIQNAYFTPQVIAAGLIYSRISDLFFKIMLSFTIALSSFIGNSMGEQNVIRAKSLIRVGIKFAVILTLTVWTILCNSSDRILSWFSTDPLVLSTGNQLISLYLFLCGLDFTQNVLGSAVKSIGKEKVVSKLFFISYYLVAAPASLLMAHVLKLRILGLYGATGLAQLLNCIVCTIFLIRVDFEEQAKFIVDRVKKNSASSLKKIKPKKFTDEESETPTSK